MKAFCFVVASIAWGLSWYGIHLQLGSTPDSVSICWRFALAAVIMWTILISTGKLRAATVQQHLWFAFMGVTLFSLNFVCLYGAEHDIPSGLVSVIFSLSTVLNALIQWGISKKRPRLGILVGAGFGCAGCVILFAPQIEMAGGTHVARGFFLALSGTALFALGNVASGYATRGGVSLPNAIARGMTWGAFILAAIILLGGQHVMPSFTISYGVGLLYLAIFASVVGFMSYLSLVAAAGAPKAAYVTVVTPIIALSISALMENYVITPTSTLGVGLILVGCILVFSDDFRLFMMARPAPRVPIVHPK